MKAARVLIVALVAAVVAIGGTLAWQRGRSATEARHSFDVRGVVRGMDMAAGTLRVQHEEIPNYMPAMTMALPVKNHALLNGLQPGDAIEFRLEVTRDDSWISRIEKIAGGAPGAKVAELKGGSRSEAPTTRVQIGERVPDFTVMDQHGRAQSLSDFRGKAVIVDFIYTRCPLPNFCPLLSRKFAELQRTLSTNVPGKFHFLSVTIDPLHDTPETMKRYAATWTKDERTWTFGTADEKEINTIASYFGLIHERTTSGQIDHDLRTALIDPQGRLVHVWRSNFWKPEEVLQRVRDL
jgi:protein SCO1/2